MALTTKAPPVPLSDLLGEWCSRPGMAEKTLTRDRWASEVITGYFSQDRDASSITRAEVLEFKELLESTYGGSTPRAILYSLVRPLERAHVEGRLPRAVTVGLLLSRKG